MRIWISLLFLWLGKINSSLFKSDIIEEGDYQDAYPKATLAIYLQDSAHVLPYLFGFLENLDYPKDLTYIDLYVENQVDSTFEKAKWWIKETSSFYRATNIEVAEGNWQEKALRRARLSRSDIILIFTADLFFTDSRVLQHLNEWNSLVVLPSLLNLYGEVPDEHPKITDSSMIVDYLQIQHSNAPLLVNLSHSDASYLTFSADNLPQYTGEKTPTAVFLNSLLRIDSTIDIDRQNLYGYNLNLTQYSLDTRRDLFNYFIARRISEFGLAAVQISSFVRPQYPKRKVLGMDEIYVINLQRRTERRKKMEKILQLLGLVHIFWDATDGQNLEKEPLFKKVKMLPGYLDPYYKRPMKTGEVGCFLSHYRIWKDVVQKKFKRVVVFEDDLNFDFNATKRLVETIEDLDASSFKWDLIYLGRKQLSNSGEVWVEGVRHLSTVGYSYWTIGYMLSQSGARKLLKAEPLKKLLPVDEFVPIMFNRHPNTFWKNAFPTRNLLAFTVYPSIVYPEKYTHDDDYVSDTESSVIVSPDEFSRGSEESTKPNLVNSVNSGNDDVSKVIIVPENNFNFEKTEL